MKKSISFFLSMFIIVIGTLAQEPMVSYGSVERLNIKSKYVDDRNVDVWLPPNYNKTKKYAVIYMHDGQMLFDSAITWNKQSWSVAENMKLIKEMAEYKECIIVGIWNNGAKRFVEYFPENILQYIKNEKDTLGLYKRVDNQRLLANNYLQFLVKELKPNIDSIYSTYTNAQNTFVMGSSMGGLISMYAMCEYPKVFGAAACLSTHFPILYTNNNNPFPNLIFQYLKYNLPNTSNHKFYFDYGNKTLDSLYKPHQIQVDKILKQKKYTSANWITKEFIGQDHSEKSWSKRLMFPLQFLLKK